MSEPAASRRQWSINALNKETLMDRRTLDKLLATVKPCAEDGNGKLYWLSDLIGVLRGDGDDDTKEGIAAAELRKKIAEADNEEIKRDKAMKTVLDGEEVFKAWEEIIAPAKTKLQGVASKMRSAAGLSDSQATKLDQEITDILTELSRSPHYRDPKQQEDLTEENPTEEKE